MPPDQPDPGSAASWLRYARSDLIVAGLPLAEGVLYDTLCFHAQQAVEKCLKAVLIHHGIEFRKAHALDYLIGLLPDDVSVPGELLDPESLSSFAVISRYPGDYELADEDTWKTAVRAAQVVYHWAERMVSGE